uniref:imidazole glycerol phosphate synthase subunit HisH n=1 Tax=Limnohabitans sp. TaxID=1907725 RepID=UPI0040484F20
MSQINSKILVVDYGMGNVGSILNMLHHIGASADVAKHPEQLIGARGIILPGVGHFDSAMEKLTRSGMGDAIKNAVSNQALPVLGICLGMQLMCKSSEEGSVSGLGFVNACVRRFKFPCDSDHKIPHMGWNNVLVQRDGTVLGNLIDIPSKYYFVHSFYVSCDNASDIIGVTNYSTNFVSAFQHKNIIGVQFHPEKSHKYGMQLFDKFVKSLS